MRIVLLALLAGGCVPVFKLKDAGRRTCASDFLEYTGGLAHHVSQGNGDGQFDYVPDAPHVTSVTGAYDLKTGAFHWDVVYGDWYKRSEAITAGTGTIWRDGDHDVAYRRAVARDDGRDEAYHVRSIRLGCEEDTRFERESDGQLFYELREYRAEGFRLEQREIYRGQFVTALGEGSADGSYTLEVDHTAGPFELSYREIGDGTGGVRREFDDVAGLDTYRGFWEVGPTGTVYDYTRDPQGQRIERWRFTIDHLGGGFGEVVYGQGGAVTCGLYFQDGQCSRQGCTDGSDGACQPPELMDLL